MLNSFDWIRRSRTGAELLATLQYLAAEPHRFSGEERIGHPHSALNSPCQRCWIYPRISTSAQKDEPYCRSCKEIVVRSRGLGPTSRRALIIWGFVNRLPKQFQNVENSGQGTKDSMPFFPILKSLLGAYVHDENRFLLAINLRKLRSWLRELILYEGTDLKGLMQILPTVGSGYVMEMGDVLCRAVHHETTYPMDKLRIRFHSAPRQLLESHKREQAGLLTFDASEFLNLLEMAMIFRKMLRPEEQTSLFEILKINNPTEAQFHWGRFQGGLTQKARDMLNLWRIRQWSKNQVKLLHELIDYVYISES